MVKRQELYGVIRPERGGPRIVDPAGEKRKRVKKSNTSRKGRQEKIGGGGENNQGGGSGGICTAVPRVCPERQNAPWVYQLENKLEVTKTKKMPGGGSLKLVDHS